MTAYARLTCPGVSGSPLTFTYLPWPPKRKRERAIVENETIQTEGDKGQDMGSHNLKLTVSGLCTPTEDAFLDGFVASQQLNATYPSGRCTYYLVDSAGNVLYNLNQLAITAYGSEPYAGNPKLMSYTLELTRFDQT